MMDDLFLFLNFCKHIGTITEMNVLRDGKAAYVTITRNGKAYRLEFTEEENNEAV